MLFYLLSRIISATGAFLYPTYASYKTLSRRPASEAELERWLMYWSVLGTIIGLEYVAEWTISWIPFYHPLKTLFLLYLALPQTRGASYIYTRHLYPLLSSHEAEIDAALGRVKNEVYCWAQQRVRGLWGQFAGGAGQWGGTEGVASPPPPPPTGMEAGPTIRAETGTAAPPTLNDPISGPVQLAYGFWRSYGPAILAGGAALLQPQPATQHSTSSLPDTPPNSSTQIPGPSNVFHMQAGDVRGTTSAINLNPQAPPHDAGSLLARRRALEAELASLPLPNPHDGVAPTPSPTFPIPQPASRPASSTYLPAYGSDQERGRYEEIRRDEVEEGDDEGEGPGDGSGGRPAPAGRRTSWWWGRSDGYERLKTD